MSANGKKERFIPEYTYSSFIICLSICGTMYFVTKYMGIGAPHDLANACDEMIPFIPSWSVIYLGCYFFWAFNAVLVAREGKKKWYRFVAAYVMAEFFCCAVFILFPTTMPRPEITGSGIFDQLMIIVYSADLPYNLLPSIHCMLSWLVTRPLLGSVRVPGWYQVVSVFACVLIFLSTLFTKQHVMIDIPTGILVAEAALYAAGILPLADWFERLFGRIDSIIFK